MQVMAADDTAAWVYRKTLGRKDVLPDPLSLRVGIFAFQGVGQESLFLGADGSDGAVVQVFL